MKSCALFGGRSINYSFVVLVQLWRWSQFQIPFYRKKLQFKILMNSKTISVSNNVDRNILTELVNSKHKSAKNTTVTDLHFSLLLFFSLSLLIYLSSYLYLSSHLTLSLHSFLYLFFALSLSLFSDVSRSFLSLSSPMSVSPLSVLRYLSLLSLCSQISVSQLSLSLVSMTMAMCVMYLCVV